MESDAQRVHQWVTKHQDEQLQTACKADVRAAQLCGDLDRARSDVERAKLRVEGAAAAFLSAVLTQGEPCPVCGSADHPNPAALAPEQGDVRERLQSAESALAAIAALSAEHDRRVAAERARFEQLCLTSRESTVRLAAAGFNDPTAYYAELRVLSGQISDLQSQFASFQAQLATRAARELALSEAENILELVRNAISAARVSLAGAMGERDTAVLSAGEAPAGVEAEGKRLRAELATSKQHAAAETEAIRNARSHWERVQNEHSAVAAEVSASDNEIVAILDQRALADPALLSALSEAGLASGETLRLALRDAPAERALARHIQGWDDLLAQLLGRQSQVDLVIAGKQPPDLGATHSAVTASDAAYATAIGARKDAESLLAHGRDRMIRYRTLCDEFAAREAGSKFLRRVAKDLTGDNALRLSFPTFILTWWLGEVLNYANVRFKNLSEGRYAFRLRPFEDDKRTKAGLGLDVFDAHSTTTRDVRTLSGGEKFQASISLALGLADVVQSRAGGVELDTLFIDEGFGSLDPAAMDRALATVAEIAGSRRVGLISHVEAIKRAVPCHVIVEASPEGSRLLLE